MLNNHLFRRVAPVVAAVTLAAINLSERSAAAASKVRVVLTSGRTLEAEVAPRTDAARLWLIYRAQSATLSRPVDWSHIATAELDGRSLTGAELKEILLADGGILFASQQTAQPANAQQAPGDDSPSEAEVLPAPDDAETSAAEALHLLFRPPPPLPPRVASVHFDAFLANWDADVETDGIILHVFPVDAAGHVVPATGTLTAQLVGQRRITFSEGPHKQGRRIDRLGQWTKRMLPNLFAADGCWFKLPFQADHPEFDTDLGRLGLLHIRLAVPGQGVFDSSIDGIRIRPYAPLRDDMERVEGNRFLAIERTGRGKRNVGPPRN